MKVLYTASLSRTLAFRSFSEHVNRTGIALLVDTRREIQPWNSANWSTIGLLSRRYGEAYVAKPELGWWPGPQSSPKPAPAFEAAISELLPLVARDISVMLLEAAGEASAHAVASALKLALGGALIQPAYFPSIDELLDSRPLVS